jgi:hypothetical protein
VSIVLNIKNAMNVRAATKHLVRIAEITGVSFNEPPFGMSKKQLKNVIELAVRTSMPTVIRAHERSGFDRPCFRVIAAHAALFLCDCRHNKGLMRDVDVYLTSELVKEMIYANIDMRAIDLFMDLFDEILDVHYNDEPKYILASMIESKKKMAA